ncbi:alpha/beta hydrolase [Nonomuraea angiospora]
MWEPILDASGKAQPIPEDVTTDDGAQITMRWYAKNDTTPGSAVLFFHGGGCLFGHIEHFDGPVTRYVSASGVPMLSVEYRRALEHPYPTPLEDAYTALKWLNGHAAEPGVDPTGSASWATAPVGVWRPHSRSSAATAAARRSPGRSS